jgi:Fic family protein
MSKNELHVTEVQIFDISKASIFSVDVISRLEEASRLVGEINQIVTNVFEYDFINEALKNIESLTSARIEGTTGNLEDLYLQDSLDYERKKALKLFSAINVRFTINELENIVKSYSDFDIALIRHLHKTLTENDPWTKGVPGKLRNNDVKISNSRLGDFYPPSHLKVSELMDRFVVEVKKDKNSYLIRAALMHYWFESLHPFEDGNGRTGRLLVTAMLLQKKFLKSPVLNVSQYFDANRDKYIEELRMTTINESYHDWVIFFLDAIIDQCNHNKELISQLRDLKANNQKSIRESTKGTHVPFNVLDFALNNMFVTVPEVKKYFNKLNLPLRDYTQAARTNIKKLVELNILEEMGKSGREKVYVHAGLKKIITSNK